MTWLRAFLFGDGDLAENEIEADVKWLIEKDSEISALQKDTKVPVIVKDCGAGIRACYRIDSREIWISPMIDDIASLREALLHEFVHAHDHLVKKIPIGTIKGLATSEIHAMKRCECHDSWFRRSCTRAKAIEAVSLSTGNEERAVDAVNLVFDEVYDEDTPVYESPFDEFLMSPYDF